MKNFELTEIVPAHDILYDEIEKIKGGMTEEGDCKSGCHDGSDNGHNQGNEQEPKP